LAYLGQVVYLLLSRLAASSVPFTVYGKSLVALFLITVCYLDNNTSTSNKVSDVHDSTAFDRGNCVGSVLLAVVLPLQLQ
jgi:hypothetical protein